MFFFDAEYLTPLFVIGVLIFLFIAIYKEWINPSYAFFGATIIFLFCGFISGQEIALGFSNTKVLCILFLIVISNSIRQNFRLEPYVNSMFKNVTTIRAFLLRMMVSVSILSTFVNNSPVVALATPFVIKYGRKLNISPSRLLIPLSFSTILGGMVTLIGTSTTLLLVGFLEARDMVTILSFHLLLIGGFVAISGILFLIILAPILLPKKLYKTPSFKGEKREYIIEFDIDDNSDFIGMVVNKSKLKKLDGAHLVEILRANNTIYPIPADEVFQKNDKLIFAGNPAALLKIKKEHYGIHPREVSKNIIEDKTQIVEAVVGANSNFVGSSPKDLGFRHRFDATIVAIQRNGEKIGSKIGTTKLAAGDLLLLFAGKDFDEKIDPHRDIILVRKNMAKKNDSKSKKIAVTCSLGLSILYFLFFGEAPLFTVLLFILTTFMATGLLTIKQIKRNIDPHLSAILFFSLALGKVIENTNTSDMIVNFILNIVPSTSAITLLLIIMILASILTNVIGNIGAVSILFPITIEMADKISPDVMSSFVLALLFGASSTFMTPFSYQTNLIIYGPGGYKLKDFFRIGFPMTLFYLTMSFIGIYLIFYSKII